MSKLIPLSVKFRYKVDEWQIGGAVLEVLRLLPHGRHCVDVDRVDRVLKIEVEGKDYTGIEVIIDLDFSKVDLDYSPNLVTEKGIAFIREVINVLRRYGAKLYAVLYLMGKSFRTEGE
ncbi:MAG: hypothetical protein DRJ40_11755 [Thermoprotei archaeon]|nr:MAG: hypothetical protein DRJ40_11755 [Thermoprotei archaeon]